MSRQLVFWLAVMLLFAGGMAVWFATKELGRVQSGGVEVGEASNGETDPLTDFTLIKPGGERFKSSALDGQVWVASFFFTTCPQNCWQMNLRIKDLVKQYGPQGVRFVSITCNPDVDTPYKMAQYADKLLADEGQWLFLTGNLDYIQRVGKEFFTVTVKAGTHTEHLMTVDRRGEVQGYFKWNDPEQMKLFDDQIQQLLKEQPALEESAEG